jgi:putative redox protein
MKAHVKWVDGMTLLGRGDTNHWIAMDGAEEIGGHDAGSRPMEMVLIGLGGCTGMDVLSILRKKRVPFTDFEIKLDSERADDHPKVFTKIKVHFIVSGKGINPNDVERAIELSETKYCSVAGMLRHSASIETSFEIVEA